MSLVVQLSSAIGRRVVKVYVKLEIKFQLRITCGDEVG